MTNKLQQYFPMIRTREEVLNEIESKSRLKNLFYEWTEENQNEFLDFCTGVKGIKIMYAVSYTHLTLPTTPYV